MTDVEVMNLNVVCRCFPESSSSEISRENLLDTIDKIFEGETKVVVVEGVEGIGKTTLLAQFAKRHCYDALSLFINPTSRLAYAPEYLRLILCEQLHWVLYGEMLNADTVDESYWRTRWPKLQKLAQGRRKDFYFIVDGLQDLPKEDSRIQDILLEDTLPLGLPGFRFLLSGDLRQFSDVIHISIPCKSFPLSNFSLDETERYLSDLLDRDSLEDIYKMCRRGIPGHLASVRRMVQSGIDIRNILDEDPTSLPDFIAMEWRKIRNAAPEQKKLLAVIAYGRRIYTLGNLSSILNLELSEVEDFLRNSGIISIDPNKKDVSYISEPHRRYAAKQLSDYQEEVNNLLIDYLLKDAESDATLTDLPNYYEQAGRFEELLNYLTPEHLTKVLARSQSLNPVRRRANLGLVTARKMNRNEDLIRFSMQNSVITDLDGAEVWRSEIEARMSLKDYDAALALAQSSDLKEDRLHLLAIIARMKREQGLIPEKELMEQIAFLYDQIDSKVLGERAVEIATDLVYSDPDLAIKLVESATSATQDKGELDWAFARLSIAALAASEDQSQFSDVVEKTQSRIKDPKIHGFSAAASILFGQYSAAQVIDRVNSLEPKNRLFFLRQWTASNQHRGDAAEVIDYALDLLIKDTPYTPKSRDLRQIAMALPSVTEIFRARQLVGRFDSQKGAIEKLGSTEDFVRLQLLLAQTESKFEFSAAKNRLMEVYWYICDLQDLAVKTECMGWMVASLIKIDPQRILESEEGLHTVTCDELQSYTNELLLTTAEHFMAVRGTIRALTKTHPELAFEVARSLNTEERRDLAMHELIKSTLDNAISELDIGFLRNVLSKMIDIELREDALILIIKRLSSTSDVLDPSFTKRTLPLIDSTKEIQDADDRCRAVSFAYSFLAEQDSNEYSGLMANLLQRLDSAWKSIDIGWLKVDTGFRIAKELAPASPESAKKYLDLTDSIKEEVIIDAESPALTYLYSLKLAIRAYSGLLPRKINTPEDLESLAILIDKLPSNGERAILWSDLALRCYTHKQFDLCQRAIADHVRPLIGDIPEGDSAYKYRVIAATAPALFAAHRTTALDTISPLPRLYRDKAYDDICDFLFRKQPPSDPYYVSRGDGYKLTYEEATDICDLLKLMQTDRVIYAIVENIAASIIAKRNRDEFTSQQKSEIANRLEGIVSAKLPDQQNIQHEGYRVAALAQIARIRRAERHVSGESNSNS